MDDSNNAKLPKALEPDAAVYSALMNRRNTELQVLWARFNINLAANIAILIAYTAKESSLRTSRWYCLAGFVLVLLWIFFELAGRRSLNRRDKQLEIYEKQFFRPDLLDVMEAERECGMPTRPYRVTKWAGWLLIAFFGASWIVLFVAQMI